MVYFNLFAGISLLMFYLWLVRKRTRKVGLENALFNFDILLGLTAGMFLASTSVISLFS